MAAANSITEDTASWIDHWTPNAKAPTRLFCFPYAGGAASIFRQWKNMPLENVEVCPVQLPGREGRLNDEPFTRLYALAKAVADILPRDKPFAFFGYSIGALLAFEVTRELRRREHTLPVHLFVSAAPAPQLCPNRPFRFNLHHEQLLVELRRLGGTAEDVLANDELLDMLIPIIRADFCLLDTYEYRSEEPLDVPITAIGGDNDPEVDNPELMAWHFQTRNEFQTHQFPGGHFFINDFGVELRSIVAMGMQRTTSVLSAG